LLGKKYWEHVKHFDTQQAYMLGKKSIAPQNIAINSKKIKAIYFFYLRDIIATFGQNMGNILR